MSKQWGIVVVLGVSTAMSAFFGCSSFKDDPTGQSQGAVEDGVILDGRCTQSEGCAGSCVYPGDGCDPSDPTCLGYCLRGGECVPDATCNGAQRCVECISFGDSISCTEVCDPIAQGGGDDGGIGGSEEPGDGGSEQPGDGGGQSGSEQPGDGGQSGSEQPGDGGSQSGGSSSSGGTKGCDGGKTPSGGSGSPGGSGGQGGGGGSGGGVEIDNPN